MKKKKFGTNIQEDMNELCVKSSIAQGQIQKKN